MREQVKTLACIGLTFGGLYAALWCAGKLVQWISQQ